MHSHNQIPIPVLSIDLNPGVPHTWDTLAINFCSMKIMDSPGCRCAAEEQTIEYLFLEYEYFEAAKIDFKKCMQKNRIWMTQRLNWLKITHKCSCILYRHYIYKDANINMKYETVRNKKLTVF